MLRTKNRSNTPVRPTARKARNGRPLRKAARGARKPRKTLDDKSLVGAVPGMGKWAFPLLKELRDE